MHKLKQTLFRVTKRIVVLFMIFICLLQTLSYGATQEEAGQALAQFCINFYNEYHTQTHYPSGDEEWDERKRMYQDPPGTLNTYIMDCVGWVSYAVHWGLGLGNDTFTFFGVPPGGSTLDGVYSSNNPAFYNGFEKVYGSFDEKDVVDDLESKLQPGDLLSQHFAGEGRHILIYVGEVNGVPSVVHMGGMTMDALNNNNRQYCNVGRITPEAAARAKPAVAVSSSWDDEDEEIEIDDNFYGLPLVGEYGGRTTIGGWIFDLLTQFIDYLGGIIFAVIKIEIIGWVRILENGITNIIQTITKTETTSEVNNEQSTNPDEKDDENKSSTDNDVQIGKINNEDENDIITIEDIIYNRIPVLDANVFNFKQAGGMDLKPNSVIYKLRETIAIWYEVFRKVAIVVMLGMLIYLGIRMSLSSIAEKKASYKRALTSWVVGFVLIFFIHYIMILVLNLNSSLVDLFNDIIANATEDISTEGTIYDTMLTRAYSLPISISLPGTVMYLVLVYYMIKFLFIYVKRYVVLNILTLMAPVMVLKYTFESAGTGKKSNAISSWLSDYVFNVLIQLIHAILYCSFMIIALQMSSESVAGFVIALIIMNFISKADKILMKIFNFGRGKSVEDTSKQETIDDVISGVAVAKSVAQTTKGAAGVVGRGAKKVTKSFGNLSMDIADIWSETDSRKVLRGASLDAQEYLNKKVLGGKSETFNNLLEAKRALNAEGGSGEDERIRKILEKRKKLKRKMRKDAFKYGMTTIGNAGMMIASIPMMVVDPGKGFAFASKAFKNIRNSCKTIDSDKNKFYPKNKAARALLNTATFGMAGSTVNALDQAKKDKDKINNELPADAKVLAKAGTTEKDINALYKALMEDDDGEDNKYEELDKMFYDITQDQINLNNIADVVEEYMADEDITQLRMEDISAVVKNLESRYGKEVNKDYMEKLENAVRNEFSKRMINGKQSLETDEVVDAIKEGVVGTHSVDTSTMDDKEKQIVSKIEELNRLEMESTKERKHQVIDTGEIIRKIQRNN